MKGFAPRSRVAKVGAGRQLRKCLLKQPRVVRSDAADEVRQGGAATGRVGDLVQRTEHQVGDKLVEAVGRRIAVGTMVAVLDDKSFVRKATQ